MARLVLVSVTVTRVEERSIVSALRERGIHVEIVRTRQAADYLNKILEPPDGVLLRNVSSTELVAMATRFEQAAIRTINTESAVRVCLGKDTQASAFARAGIPHPRSFVAFTIEQVEQYFDLLSGDAVVKPVHGSWGRGVVRLRGRSEFEAWRAAWEAVDPAGRSMPVLVQRPVPKPGFDIRVLVVGDRPICAFRRTAAQWRTNTSLGAEVQPIEIDETITALCARVVGLLGRGVYGIDLIESAESGEVAVLEVNANPEFARSSTRHDIEVAGAIADYVHQVLCNDPSGDGVIDMVEATPPALAVGRAGKGGAGG